MVTESLISRCIREERKAQYEMYRALYPLMMSICSRYERNKQDAVARMNIGFLKILQNLEQRRKEVPFDAWARRIMINTVIDEFRREKPRKEHEVIGGSVDNITTISINEYVAAIEAEDLEALMRQLPPVSRNVFNLFAIDGFSHAEIAEMIGISTGTSKWHVSHARSVLQQKLVHLATKKATYK